MPDDLEFEVNDLIDGRYRVLALLGRGGMGKVIKCYDEMLDKEVALKLLLDLDADQFAVRFQKEAQTTARLSHPNIVRVMDFGQTGAGELFLVMDLLEGKSLEDLLLEKGAFSVDETFEFGIQIGLALSHAHRNGVLHRDIKPSNVMLVKDDRGKYQAKLVDFGLAKFVQDDERLTSTGVGLGSPPYVSPEQGDGKEIDERADIYSFGCLLFAMLVGRPPFLADNPLATVLMHMKNPPPSLAEIKKEDFPLAVEALISRCLKKKPAQRPQSFDSLVEEIKSLKEALKYGT
ncbi:MAG: serine/threonine protein kinase, partial [Candidatus Obscuribacterales bacterium]|nr:serine/threonine protein kinase [Candidatus Obscuribacterales bacterium]